MTTFITPACPVCGSPSYFENLDYDKLRAWRGGELIQEVWPDIDVDDRELMVSGTHPDCWDSLFEDDEDEEPMSEMEMRDIRRSDDR